MAFVAGISKRFPGADARGPVLPAGAGPRVLNVLEVLVTPADGRIDGTNNLLQVLRRQAHGFANYTNFEARGILVA